MLNSAFKTDHYWLLITSNEPDRVPESVGKPVVVSVTGPENIPEIFPPMGGVLLNVVVPVVADGVML